MATSIELVLNLRSAREWNSGFEDADGTAHWKSSAGAEECSRRLERILAAARVGGLEPQAKPRRAISSSIRRDLGLQEAVIAGVVQFLQRRQASGAFL